MNEQSLIEALGTSQRLGFLGDAPIPRVIEHARGFVAALRTAVVGVDERGGGLRIVDIGTGGGVPGLVIAWDFPAARVLLVDRRRARTDHVERLVGRLGMEHRVAVRNADLASTPADLRGGFDAVTARGFGPPERTLAAAGPLLRAGGVLVVSEPPGADGERWASALIEPYGMVHEDTAARGVAVLRANR